MANNNAPELPTLTEQPRSEMLKNSIRELLQCIADVTGQKKIACVRIMRRDEQANVRFKPDVGFVVVEEPRWSVLNFTHNPKRFSTFVCVLKSILEILETGGWSTRRAIMYQYPELEGDQQAVNEAVDDVACYYGVTREDLGIISTPRGALYGDLMMSNNEGQQIYCLDNREGTPIQSVKRWLPVTPVRACYLLVIEKETVFQRLLSEGFINHENRGILITSKGYADVDTRRFVCSLASALQIPTFALMDNDPDGFRIMLNYIRGSMCMAFMNELLTVPSMRWLGVKSTDVTKYSIPGIVQLNVRETSLIDQLLQDPLVMTSPSYVQELTEMRSQGAKCSIDCITNYGTYLIAKLKEEGILPH